jgi:hypothetical protein
VPLAGEHERALHELPVDLLRGVAGVLLDDGEQVAQQDALILGELRLRPAGVRVLTSSTG